MNITQEQKNAIIELTDNSKLESDILYIIEESDAKNIDDLTDEIDEQTNGFQVEIIYHNRAMEYLSENDPSLQYSLEIAKDLGFELENLNSETLATLLASQNEREAYDEIKDELNDILFTVAEEETEESK